MNVYISKNAVLFHKAIEDLWVADLVWKVSPNIAVWHCTQAAEKTLKGLLQCHNKDYENDHRLDDLLDLIAPIVQLPEETIKYILYLNGFGTGLRYKHMKSDPTVEEAKTVIVRTKIILQEFRCFQSVSQFMAEAEEVHTKILKSSLQETSDDSKN